ncbi:thiosulfate sulfurtransferase GlpE [Halomonas urmiana]|uniref:Thiosulfate sulfurtransferase GlpE n=1 Tax=Halomonas urmiana TaxID=490901 RepID=A0A5R8MI19_9GAMM|nr:thiosulfate sulfurtransferase GlpE [Halomonas urmiana]TLF51593.1 thiosulfate sulfurtransferase GlpE [Halomonas urmiana]
MTTAPFYHLDIPALADWLEGDSPLTLVDIRDPQSFAQGRVPGSQRLGNDTVEAFLGEAPRQPPLVVICYHGHSSQQAAAWLAGQGFAEVYSLDGGFTDWQHRHPDRVER